MSALLPAEKKTIRQLFFGTKHEVGEQVACGKMDKATAMGCLALLAQEVEKHDPRFAEELNPRLDADSSFVQEVADNHRRHL